MHCLRYTPTIHDTRDYKQKGVTRGYKDGLQPETLADGNWLVKQNQPVLKYPRL